MTRPVRDAKDRVIRRTVGPHPLRPHVNSSPVRLVTQAETATGCSIDCIVTWQSIIPPEGRERAELLRRELRDPSQRGRHVSGSCALPPNPPETIAAPRSSIVLLRLVVYAPAGVVPSSTRCRPCEGKITFEHR